MQVYHFVGKTLRDGRPVPDDGVWLEHKGPIIPCQSGLHGSEHPYGALIYASGSTLCLCDLEGELQPHGDPVDKWVGRRRRIVQRINADYLLRRFAADEALKVAHLWDMPEVVREYLTTLNPELRATSQEESRAAMRTASQESWEMWMASMTASLVSRASMTANLVSRAASQVSLDASRAASPVSLARWAASPVSLDASWEASLAVSREEFRRRVEATFQEGNA